MYNHYSYITSIYILNIHIWKDGDHEGDPLGLTYGEAGRRLPVMVRESLLQAEETDASGCW